MSKFPTDTENRISKKFQNRLLSIIEEQDCSNEEFALLVGVSTPVITKAITFGILPTTRILTRIADKLECSVLYLLGEVDEDNFISSVVGDTFFDRLELLKNEKKVSYRKIALDMPFCQSYFSDWKKNGTVPALEYVFALSQYFGVSIDYLLGRSDYRQN